MAGQQPKHQLSLIPQDELVVKSNEFITAKYDWSPTEHRIIAMMIAQLKKDESSFSVQTVRIRDLREMSHTDSKDLYRRGEEICQKLLAQKIEIRSVDAEGNREYEGYNLLSKCKYQEGSGKIKAKFNEDMRPFLLELRRRFTMYGLQYLMRLRSQYSIRIYETLKMREDIGFNRMTIPELREMLMITSKYTGSFAQVKAKVLEPARKEIKEKCDVYFTYHVERDGRTPVAVNFMIHANEDVEPAVSSDEIEQIEEKVGRRAQLEPSAVDDAPRNTTPATGNGAAPEVDGYKMFLMDLSQEELAGVSDTELSEMKVRAKSTVDEQCPDAGSAVRATELYRTLMHMWEGEQEPPSGG